MSLKGGLAYSPAVDRNLYPWGDASVSGRYGAIRFTDFSGSAGSTCRLIYPADSADVAQRGTRTLAIAGDVSWRDDDLADLASREGDASALDQALSSRGSAAFDRISGGFTVAIIDSATGKLTLALDRMGIGRMVWRIVGDAIVFSNSVSDVASATKESPVVRPQAFLDYLFFHEIPSPGTIYEGIFKLEPGELLEFEHGRAEIRRYWQPRFLDDTHDRPGIDELLETCRRAVGRQLNGTETATFLSGGLDSSTVTVLASEIADAPLPAVSIGFDEPGFDEMHYANVVAKHVPVNHVRYYVTPHDVCESAPLIASSCDEPFGNSSVVPTYFCARVAREAGSTVMLAGDGGDELFGGNERYAKQRLFSYFDFLPSALQSLSSSIADRTIDSKIMPLRKFGRYVAQARVPLPDRLETHNLLMQTGMDQVFEPEFMSRLRPEGPFDIMRSAYDRPDETIDLNRMLYLDWKLTLADNDLRKVSMGCSLAQTKVSFPLLDLDVVDLSMRLGRKDKLSGRTLRPFFRNACATILPRDTIKKGKHGFGLPFGLWMLSDDKLRSLADDAISSFSRRGIARNEFLAWLQDQHRNDHASYYGSVIWAIMMLELWLSERGIARL